MNPISPKKLLHSKWTAVTPRNRQRHFLVTKVLLDDEGTPRSCILEAVLSRHEQEIDWRELRNEKIWRIGWLS